MKRISSLFVDKVNGRTVFEYKDCYGQLFMAQSKLGFRVNKPPKP